MSVHLQWLDLHDYAGESGAMLVRIVESSDLVGLGEVSLPKDSPSRGVIDLLRACAERLEVVNPRNIHVAIDAISEVTDQDPTAGPAVRCALDVALHDLAGRRRGVPVHAVLGGARRKEIGLTALADAEAVDPETLAGFPAVRLFWRSGLDVGAGAGLASTLDRIRTSVQVDVDVASAFGNSALARSFVEGVLRERARVNLALLQPLRSADLLGHSALRESLPLPVVVESSLRSAIDMAQIVRLGAADRVVAEIDRLGGLREASRVASIAESAAIGVTAAGRGKTAVGAAAVLHLAAALQDNYPAYLAEFGINTGLWASGGFSVDPGVARLEATAGLGIVLSAEISESFQPLR